MRLVSYIRNLYRGHSHLQGHVFPRELEIHIRVIIMTSIYIYILALEIKMLDEDDDLNANYLSEEKKLIKEQFSRIEKNNEKIREICIKDSLNTEECGFDQQKYENFGEAEILLFLFT